MIASSETQGRSVGPGEKARRNFSSTGGKAPGYWLSPDCFQTVKRMLALDWAQKMLFLIVPNWRTASPESFSWVCTRRLLTRSRFVWLHPRRPRDSQSGREKRRDESFQVRAKEPLGTDSHRTISKNSSVAGSWLGTKNALYYCVQSANSFSWVLFVSSYTTAIVSITACLMHQRNARSQQTFSLI